MKKKGEEIKTEKERERGKGEGERKIDEKNMRENIREKDATRSTF